MSEQEIIVKSGFQCVYTVFSLFASIQNDAFKCKKKIVKTIKRAEADRKAQTISPKEQGRAMVEYDPILLKPGITYVYQKKPSLSREIVRRCEAWTVRGHYRHLKSGKIVYVRPHKKGKGRLKNTEYTVAINSSYGGTG